MNSFVVGILTISINKWKALPMVLDSNMIKAGVHALAVQNYGEIGSLGVVPTLSN